jgi:hypothetical protein
MAQATRKLAPSGDVGVFLLDPDGHQMFRLRGWRGRELFVGYWEAEPAGIVEEIASDLGIALEMHSIVPSPERTWVILRTITRYFDASDERRAVSGEFRRSTEPSDH